MTADNTNVITWPGDPIGPNTPAWEAGDDAVKALAHVIKQIRPHVKDENLADVLGCWMISLVEEAKDKADIRKVVGWK